MSANKKSGNVIDVTFFHWWFKVAKRYGVVWIFKSTIYLTIPHLFAVTLRQPDINHSANIEHWTQIKVSISQVVLSTFYRFLLVEATLVKRLRGPWIKMGTSAKINLHFGALIKTISTTNSGMVLDVKMIELRWSDCAYTGPRAIDFPLLMMWVLTAWRERREIDNASILPT